MATLFSEGKLSNAFIRTAAVYSEENMSLVSDIFKMAKLTKYSNIDFDSCSPRLYMAVVVELFKQGNDFVNVQRLEAAIDMAKFKLEQAGIPFR
jgi:hypothetical protein